MCLRVSSAPCSSASARTRFLNCPLTGPSITTIVPSPVSGQFRNRVLALAEEHGALDTRKHNGSTYYAIDDNDAELPSGIDAIDDMTYFSFAVSGKVLIASDEPRLIAMLDNGGYVAGAEAHRDALFVLTADKDFVQAGMRTDQFADDEDDWDSNILRNTEQAAVLISDKAGQIAFEAQLVASDPQMTESIGGIVNGLISLQAFNSELDPAAAQVLRNTKVKVDEKVLSISTVVDPTLVVALLED